MTGNQEKKNYVDGWETWQAEIVRQKKKAAGDGTNNIFGERLRECLQQRGMKQCDLAEATGLTEVTVSRYITGQRRPNTKILAGIANALHVTSDMLLGKDAEHDPETAFNLTALLARDYAGKWTRAQKLMLMNIIFGKDDAR